MITAAATSSVSAIFFDAVDGNPNVWVDASGRWTSTSISDLEPGKEFGFKGRRLVGRLLEIPVEEVAPDQRFKWHNNWYQRTVKLDRPMATFLKGNRAFGEQDSRGHALPFTGRVQALRFFDLGKADHP